MEWSVLIGDEFEPGFFALPKNLQDETLATTRLLQLFGPQLERPHVDTLKDSRHANVEESTLMPPTEFGTSPSHLTPSAEPPCSWRVINRGVSARSAFIAS
jgi:hypothetical protein